MPCTAERRRRIESAEHALRARDAVVAVTVVGDELDPTDKPTFDVVCRPTAGGVPPAVADVCATHGLTTRRVARQGAHWQALLVA